MVNAATESPSPARRKVRHQGGHRCVAGGRTRTPPNRVCRAGASPLDGERCRPRADSLALLRRSRAAEAMLDTWIVASEAGGSDRKRPRQHHHRPPRGRLAPTSAMCRWRGGGSWRHGGRSSSGSARGSRPSPQRIAWGNGKLTVLRDLDGASSLWGPPAERGLGAPPGTGVLARDAGMLNPAAARRQPGGPSTHNLGDCPLTPTRTSRARPSECRRPRGGSGVDTAPSAGVYGHGPADRSDGLARMQARTLAAGRTVRPVLMRGHQDQVLRRRSRRLPESPRRCRDLRRRCGQPPARTAPEPTSQRRNPL